jgi:A nuclease family of the HNH/ENDO VII superfamily with conserved AHH
MRGFRRREADVRYKNFQQHHLIPIAVLKNNVLLHYFNILEQHGFSPHDFTSNGILLPSTVSAAEKHNLPLHRGPHKYYNDLVFDCVQIIISRYDFVACNENEMSGALNDLTKLQASLKAMLRQGKALVFLSNYDPNYNTDLCQGRESMRSEFITILKIKFHK